MAPMFSVLATTALCITLMPVGKKHPDGNGKRLDLRVSIVIAFAGMTASEVWLQSIDLTPWLYGMSVVLGVIASVSLMVTLVAAARG